MKMTVHFSKDVLSFFQKCTVILAILPGEVVFSFLGGCDANWETTSLDLVAHPLIDGLVQVQGKADMAPCKHMKDQAQAHLG